MHKALHARPVNAPRIAACLLPLPQRMQMCRDKGFVAVDPDKWVAARRQTSLICLPKA